MSLIWGLVAVPAIRASHVSLTSHLYICCLVGLAKPETWTVGAIYRRNFMNFTWGRNELSFIILAKFLRPSSLHSSFLLVILIEHQWRGRKDAGFWQFRKRKGSVSLFSQNPEG